MHHEKRYYRKRLSSGRGSRTPTAQGKDFTGPGDHHVVPDWQAWEESNPTLTVLETGRQPMLRPMKLSGWQDSNLRSPVSETGGIPSFPTPR